MHTNHSDIMEWNSYRFQNEIVTFFIMGIAGTVTASLGVIGNLISLSILFRRRKNWITTDIYLIGLTMSDLLLLIFFILIALKDTRKPNLKVAQWLMWQDVAMVPKVFPVCHALLLFFQVSSIWLTTFLSVERFFIICYPFKAERICSLKIASINTTLVVAASLVYNIPRFFEYILWSADWSQPVLSDYLNTTSIYNFTNTQFLKMQYTWYDISEFGKSPSFRIWYTLYSWIVLVFLGPIITIVITNSLLLIEIKRVNRRAKRNNFNVVDVNQDTNKMLIGVIFFFLLTQIPASISHVIWAYMAGDKFQQWYFIINEIGNYLVILNSAINIVSYLIFSKRFRKEFIKIIKEIMGPRRFVEEQRGTSRDVEFSNRYRNSSPWRRNLRLNDGEVKAIVEKNEI